MYGNYSLKHYGGDDNDEERGLMAPNRESRRASHPRSSVRTPGGFVEGKDKGK